MHLKTVTIRIADITHFSNVIVLPTARVGRGSVFEPQPIGPFYIDTL